MRGCLFSSVLRTREVVHTLFLARSARCSTGSVRSPCGSHRPGRAGRSHSLWRLLSGCPRHLRPVQGPRVPPFTVHCLRALPGGPVARTERPNWPPFEPFRFESAARHCKWTHPSGVLWFGLGDSQTRVARRAGIYVRAKAGDWRVARRRRHSVARPRAGGPARGCEKARRQAAQREAKRLF